MLERTRITVRNVLFATDFSSASEAATPYVDAIARRYGAKVFLAHVVSPSSFAWVPPDAGGAAFESVWQTAKAQLADFAASTLRAVRHETLLAEGDVAAALRELVDKQEIGLIILGTHGRTGLNWFLMGSVAESILKLTPCPVLIVGPRAPREVSWTAHARRILYATDFTHESLAGLDYALDLAQENQSKLTLITVLAATDTDSVYRATLNSSTLRRLRSLVPEEAALWCEPEFLVEFGSPAEVIKERAQRDHDDLIILGGRSAIYPERAGGHKFGTVTHKVISGAPCAVLSVPERRGGK
jgi:nucleotide-binding universal stress UspA family protein